ncbi:MAG: hypothetical protein J6S14_15675 [Clostridia bacterium]|nr:hypothetical protein [Clostridia bacterium]
MSKIKVTVEYESPPEDKFAALMAEYKAAKAAADEAKSTIQPLINAGMEAKYEAICKQLEELGQKLKEYHFITKTGRLADIECVVISTMYPTYGGTAYFTLRYSPHEGLVCYAGDSKFFSHKEEANCQYVLKHWNTLHIIEELEKDLLRKMKSSIKAQLDIPQTLQTNLKLAQEG